MAMDSRFDTWSKAEVNIESRRRFEAAQVLISLSVPREFGHARRSLVTMNHPSQATRDDDGFGDSRDKVWYTREGVKWGYGRAPSSTQQYGPRKRLVTRPDSWWNLPESTSAPASPARVVSRTPRPLSASTSPKSAPKVIIYV